MDKPRLAVPATFRIASRSRATSITKNYGSCLDNGRVFENIFQQTLAGCYKQRKGEFGWQSSDRDGWKTPNGPAVTATTCSQGLVDALNAGFRIQSSNAIGGPSAGSIYTLVRGGTLVRSGGDSRGD
jgi:hypothetical protein